MLPDDRAMETISAAPPNLLPGLTGAVPEDRRRRRVRVAAVMAGVAITADARLVEEPWGDRHRDHLPVRRVGDAERAASWI
jgi:hypothetical protein